MPFYQLGFGVQNGTKQLLNEHIKVQANRIQENQTFVAAVGGLGVRGALQQNPMSGSHSHFVS